MAQQNDSLLSILPPNAYVMARRVQEEIPESLPRIFQFKGSPQPALLFVGENILEGASAELLSRMIAPMNAPMNAVAVASIPNLSLLSVETPPWEELSELNPKIIVLLGLPLAQKMLMLPDPLDVLRGSFHLRHSLKIRVTESPEELLKTPAAKRAAWEDLKRVMQELNWKNA